MSHNFYRFKKELIERRNREAADRHIEEMETNPGPWFWVAVGMLAFYLMWVH